mgnify:FL=1
MKNKILSFLMFLVSILWLSCSNNNLNKELNTMATNLNEAAPAQLDENTLFLGAQVDVDNTFKYLYQIINTNNADSIMNEMEEQTRDNIKEAFRINPDLAIFTANDINIEYVYHDSLGQVIKTIHITPQDYK